MQIFTVGLVGTGFGFAGGMTTEGNICSGIELDGGGDIIGANSVVAKQKKGLGVEKTREKCKFTSGTSGSVCSTSCSRRFGICVRT